MLLSRTGPNATTHFAFVANDDATGNGNSDTCGNDSCCCTKSPHKALP